MQQQDTEDLVQLASRYGIEVRADTLRRNSSGLDFEVALAEDGDGSQWVLRSPRREDVWPRAIQERRTLDLIRTFVSFETPHWQVCEPDLIAYRALRGVPAGRFTTQVQDYLWGDPAEVPAPFTASLAQALADLHQVPKDRAIHAGLPVIEASDLRRRMDDRMHRVREVFDIEGQLWARWQAWLEDEQMWPSTTGLIHGDLHPGHLLVSSDIMVTGILDWTEAKVEDISHDFVYPYLAFGEAALDLLITLYEDYGGTTWPLMKVHVVELAATFPLQIAEFAMATHSDEMEQMATELLGGASVG